MGEKEHGETFGSKCSGNGSFEKEIGSFEEFWKEKMNSMVVEISLPNGKKSRTISNFPIPETFLKNGKEDERFVFIANFLIKIRSSNPKIVHVGFRHDSFLHSDFLLVKMELLHLKDIEKDAEEFLDTIERFAKLKSFQ